MLLERVESKKMKVEMPYYAMFNQTPVSDLFLSDFLPELDPMGVKVYLYCLYLAKLGREVTPSSLATDLQIHESVLGETLIGLQGAGLLLLQKGSIVLVDVGQKELERFYRPRTTGGPLREETTAPDERTQIMKAVSDRFFCGQMPPSWYNEIDFWFEKYGFEPQVVYMLFQQCASRQVMTKPYLRAVAESWGNQKIHTVEQLEAYLKQYEVYKDVRTAILKKLRWGRNLNVYEEAIVEKWFFTYGYSLEIIELALRKSVSKTNATLATFDAILSDWFQNGLKTPEEILRYEEARRKRYAASKSKGKGEPAMPQKNNYTERKYDADFLNSFYEESGHE